ncbi:unnamed protein product, partial [Cyprideis torosa]
MMVDISSTSKISEMKKGRRKATANQIRAAYYDCYGYEVLVRYPQRDGARESTEVDDSRKSVENREDKGKDKGTLVGCAELESHLSASPQPRLQIVPRRSPEIVRSVDLGEALRTLDFQNGVRDPRRFRYICKLLEVLIADHLTNLPGCVQKLVITLLEEVLDEVQKTQSHVDVIRTLLAHVEAILCDYHCWGHPLGSSQLWRERLTGLRDLLRRADNVVVEKCRSSGQGCRELSDIPPECIREIMAKLEHHRDLEAVGGMDCERNSQKPLSCANFVALCSGRHLGMLAPSHVIRCSLRLFKASLESRNSHKSAKSSVRTPPRDNAHSPKPSDVRRTPSSRA